MTSLWWPGEWDRLLSKVENWILKKNGYSKMQPQRLSRGYQSLVSKPRTVRVCTTFRFERGSSLADYPDQIKDTRSKSLSYPIDVPIPPSRKNVTDVRLEQHSINKLDRMEHMLRQYEKVFTKLPRRGPQFTSRIHNHTLDVLSEDVIQNIFLKCYIKRESELAVQNF